MSGRDRSGLRVRVDDQWIVIGAAVWARGVENGRVTAVFELVIMPGRLIGIDMPPRRMLQDPESPSHDPRLFCFRPTALLFGWL